VTTVRTDEKKEKILHNYPEYKDKLSVEIVPDIAQLNAFDEVVANNSDIGEHQC
jgi:hypothetical protein